MEQTEQLQALMNEVAGRVVISDNFRRRLDLLSPEDRARDFKRIAGEIKIDPEIVDTFDLAGIETETIQGFFEEVHARFFEENSLSPER